MIGIRYPVIFRLNAKVGNLHFLVQELWVAQRDIDSVLAVMAPKTIKLVLGRIAKDHFAPQHKFVVFVRPVQAPAEDFELLFVQFSGMNVQFPDRSSPAEIIHDVVGPLRLVKPGARSIEEAVYHSVSHESVQREKFFLQPEKLVQKSVTVPHLTLGPAGDRITEVVILVFAAHEKDPGILQPPWAVVYSRRYALMDTWFKLPFHVQQRGRFAHVGFRALLF